MTTERIPALDGLRGCAVLLVLAHHFVALSPLLEAPIGTPRAYLRVALQPTTAWGVDLFFVISGFLIGGILFDHHGSRQLLRAFYIRRFLRIVPLAWLCISIGWLYGRVSGTEAVQGPAPWWSYFAFTVNFHLAANNGWWSSVLTPLWSVAVEEQFYLLLPWIVQALPRQRLVWVGPGLVLTAILIRTTICVFLPDRLFACHVLMPCRLDAFGCGIAAASVVRSAWWKQWQPSSILLLSCLGLAAIAPSALVKLHSPQYHLALWGYTAVALFFAVFLLILVQTRKAWLRATFTSAVLREYGRLSYFVYVFQMMFAGWVIVRLPVDRTASPLLFQILDSLAPPILILIPARISWRFLEAPILALGRRLRY